MFIRKEDYNKLRDENVELATKVSALENQCQILENNCTTLLNQLNAQKSNDCSLGEWCKDCKHYGWFSLPSVGQTKIHLYSPPINAFEWVNSWTLQDGENIIYCKRHLHDICPEWEKVEDSGKVGVPYDNTY